MQNATPCGNGYACADVTTCRNSCGSDSDCAANYYCNVPTNTTCLPKLFGAPSNLTVNAPEDLAAALLNGDTTPDLLVSSLGTNSVSVFLGNGSGGFTAGTSVSTDTGPTNLLVADFNQDNKIDFAVSCTNNTVDVFLGKGDGTFMNKVAITGLHTPKGLATGHFNGVGYADLVISEQGIKSASIALGNNNGTFAVPSANTLSAAPFDLVVADFDGDGSDDVAAATAYDSLSMSNVEVLPGNGTRVLPTHMPYMTDNGTAYALAQRDLNNDTHPDLVVVDFAAGNIRVLRNDSTVGAIVFTVLAQYATGSNPTALALGHFNADTNADVAVANSGGSTVTVWLGTGNATFINTHDYAAGTMPTALVAADFNGDGKDDLAVANAGSNNVSVLLNISP
jgi:hypothetical protein